MANRLVGACVLLPFLFAVSGRTAGERTQAPQPTAQSASTPSANRALLNQVLRRLP